MPTPNPVTARRLALAVMLSFTVSLFAQSLFAQNGPTTVRRDVHHDVSQPLLEMIKHAPPPSLERRPVEPMKLIPLPPGLTQQEDPVIQVGSVAPPTPPVTQSFEGLGNGQYGFSVTSAPPDTEGTVGATQYVQWVNTSFAVFNKSTGALVAGPTAGNTMWSGFGGGCQTNNDGDPIVTYDKLAQRWIFSQFSVSTTPYLQCIAVSTTSDATGTYNRYSFQYSNFDDYPKMSVWSDAYYETFNMFAGGTTFVGADACAYDRSASDGGQHRDTSLLPAGNFRRRAVALRSRRHHRSSRRFTELHVVFRHQQLEPLQIPRGLRQSCQLHLHRPDCH